MKKIMTLIILAGLFSPNVFAEMQEVFIVKLDYNDKEISLDSLTTSSVYFNEEKDQPENGYSLKLNSLNNEELFNLKFEFPLVVFDSNITELDQAETRLIIPYYEEAKIIEIYSSENELLLDINVRNLIENVCGDGICDEQESYESCSIDCSEENNTKINKILIYILVSIFLIIILAIIFFLKHRREKEVL